MKVFVVPALFCLHSHNGILHFRFPTHQAPSLSPYNAILCHPIPLFSLVSSMEFPHPVRQTLMLSPQLLSLYRIHCSVSELKATFPSLPFDRNTDLVPGPSFYDTVSPTQPAHLLAPSFPLIHSTQRNHCTRTSSAKHSKEFHNATNQPPIHLPVPNPSPITSTSPQPQKMCIEIQSLFHCGHPHTLSQQCSYLFPYGSCPGAPRKAVHHMYRKCAACVWLDEVVAWEGLEEEVMARKGDRQAVSV